FSHEGFCKDSAITFHNLTKTILDKSPLTYFWDLGDGTSSILDSLSHTYSSSGNFTVSLIASNHYNCADTISKPVRINQVNADFSISDSILCLDKMLTITDNTL